MAALARQAPDDISRLPPISEIDERFVPKTEAEFLYACMSWRWRIFSGMLYMIIVKSEDPDDPGTVIPFRPNEAQRAFLARLGFRNVILKARQLGFTTLIAILWLDHALFHKNQRVGIIAHTLEDAFSIFRDKVKFAYENLPPFLLKRMPYKTMTKSEILFGHNNSAIRVATSMRSGTIHRLHISEMGKIAAKFPEKAVEIVTGSLPAVPKDGIAVVESTAEGQDGEFYRMATAAEQKFEAGTTGPRGWVFHFFPWYTDGGYIADPAYTTITDEDHAYFDQVEEDMGVLLSNRQRAWYVLQRDEDFAGDQAKMWREYPSSSGECWQQSTEGRYYAPQLARVRMQGRLRSFDYEPNFPVYTFWDIGASDGTGVWCMQKVGEERRFLTYIENWNQGFAATVQELEALKYTYAWMCLPHDAENQRQIGTRTISALDILQEIAPRWTFVVVDRIPSLEVGHEVTRKHFHSAVFEQTGCAKGLRHLANYQRRWNSAVGHWAPEPLKNEATESADAFRQWAQMEEFGELFSGPAKKRKRAPRASAL